MAKINKLASAETDHQWKQIKYLRSQGAEAFCAGDISTAAKLFSKALQIDAGLNEVLMRKSTTKAPQNLKADQVTERKKFDKTGMLSVLDAACRRADQSIKTNPECAKGYLAKGVALLLQDKWDEARETYIKGINSCNDCTALRAVFKKLDQTQQLLHSLPPQFQDTESSTDDRSSVVSSRNHNRCGVSVCDHTNPLTNGKRVQVGYYPQTPRHGSRKFRLQLRKKLANDPARVSFQSVKTSP